MIGSRPGDERLGCGQSQKRPGPPIPLVLLVSAANRPEANSNPAHAVYGEKKESLICGFSHLCQESGSDST